MKSEKKKWYFYYYENTDLHTPIYFGETVCIYPEKTKVYKELVKERSVKNWNVTGYTYLKGGLK